MMEKYVYMSRKDIMKKVVEDLFEDPNREYVIKKEVLERMVEEGVYASYKSAVGSTASTWAAIVKEMGLKTLHTSADRGNTARYYKRLPKEPAKKEESTVDLSGIIKSIEALTEAVMYIGAGQKKTFSMIAQLQADIIKQQTKPKANATAKDTDKPKEFNFEIDVKDNIHRLIGQDVSALSFEWYSMNVEEMVKYIGAKEKLTENQIKTFMYTEMHKEYGYTFPVEKKHFVSSHGRQPRSGVEIMYENKDYRNVFYNKIADRLANDYNL